MSKDRHMRIYWLETCDYRRAVVVDRSPKDAVLRANMEDPHNGWYEATPHFLTECRASMTPRVVALERKNR